MSPFDLFLLLSPLCFLYFYYYHHLLLGKKNKAQGPQLPPGPMGWPVLGNLPQLGPKIHHTFHAMSKIYGPILRLRFGSMDVVVASSATAATEFLRSNDTNFCDRPVTFSTVKEMLYNYHGVLFAPYGQRWRTLRKVSALHLLCPKALEDLRHIRQEELSLLVHALYAHAQATTDPVNLGNEIHMTASNTLARSIVGHRVFARVGDGEEERLKAEEFKEMVLGITTLSGQVVVGDFIPILRWLDIGGMVKKMKHVHCRWEKFLNKLIDDCRTATAAAAAAAAPEEERGRSRKREDLLSALIGLNDDGDQGDEVKLSDVNIKGLLLETFTAGTDTSSSTIEWAITEMIRQPDILKKAQQEIDSVVGRDRLVSESDIANLPFLQAVVKETFRLHPATPMSIPRMASKECIVGGYKIPKNATLFVNIWAIGRDENTWQSPLDFCPARFLPGGEGANIDVKGNNFELIPFGSGRRVCSGIIYAIRVISSTVATLIHAFDWPLPVGQMPEKLDMEEAYGITLQRAVPLMAHPVTRLAQKAYGIEE